MTAIEDRERAKTFRTWQSGILRYWRPQIDRQLHPGVDVAVLKLVVLAIGQNGDYGVNCKISDGKVGEQIGRDRRTVWRHKMAAIDFGALRHNGSKSGRIKLVNVGEPADRAHQWTAMAAPATPALAVAATPALASASKPALSAVPAADAGPCAHSNCVSARTINPDFTGCCYEQPQPAAFGVSAA